MIRQPCFVNGVMNINNYDEIKLDNQLCFPLYACAKEVVRQYRKPLEPLNLTYTQYIVMMVLWEFGSMTEGELMTMVTYALQVLSSLMMLSMIFVMITISRASAERVCEVLSEETDLKNPENPLLEVADGSIEFKDVVFSYGKNTGKGPLLV